MDLSLPVDKTWLCLNSTIVQSIMLAAEFAAERSRHWIPKLGGLVSSTAMPKLGLTREICEPNQSVGIQGLFGFHPDMNSPGQTSTCELLGWRPGASTHHRYHINPLSLPCLSHSFCWIAEMIILYYFTCVSLFRTLKSRTKQPCLKHAC